MYHNKIDREKYLITRFAKTLEIKLYKVDKILMLLTIFLPNSICTFYQNWILNECLAFVLVRWCQWIRISVIGGGVVLNLNILS